MLAQLERLDLFESVGNLLNIDGMILDARKVECLAGSVTVTIDVDALGQLEGKPHRPGGHRPPPGHRGPEDNRRPDDRHRPEHGGGPDGPHHGRPPMRPERPERPPQAGGGNGETKETITITFHQFGANEYGTLNVGGEEMGLSHDGNIWAEMPDNTVRALVVDQDVLNSLFESGAARITSVTPTYRIQ